MGARSTPLAAAVALAVVCAVVATLEMGAGALVAAAVVGAAVGAWAHVYALCMCASKPLDVAALGRAALLGALLAPAVLVVEHALGTVVWVVLALGALVWAAAVSDGGHLHQMGPGRHPERLRGDTPRP